MKTWATFAGRADVLMLLARTDPDRRAGHRGLSVLIVEKPRAEGHAFAFDDGRGGKMEGRAIDTIGYRGMHSYEVAFDNWFVPAENLIGGEAGLGRGFYLQMAGFENGRLQTAARAVGLMQAAFEAGLSYAQERKVFGAPVFDYQLSKVKLARMAALIQAGRQFSYDVARKMAAGEGTLEASMVKAYVCRAAEWVTREAMQLHGGMGYAEEFPVSRFFVDARVLSIFEGADETLCLRVIARRLAEQALDVDANRGPDTHRRRRAGAADLRSRSDARAVREVGHERRELVARSRAVVACERRERLRARASTRGSAHGCAVLDRTRFAASICGADDAPVAAAQVERVDRVRRSPRRRPRPAAPSRRRPRPSDRDARARRPALHEVADAVREVAVRRLDEPRPR